MVKDWRNEDDYAYMDNHTPELWAWEFLRRNPDYIKDWETTFSQYVDDRKKNYIPKVKTILENKEKFCLVPGYSKEVFLMDMPERERETTIKLLLNSIYDLSAKPTTLNFPSARSKWGLFISEIIDPDVDCPSNELDFPLFYTHGYVFSSESFHILKLTGLETSEAVVVFDLSKPIQQQYEQVKDDLEEEQKAFLCEDKIKIRKNTNKAEVWQRYIRILDAYEVKTKPKDIAANIFPNVDNEYPDYLGDKNVASNFRLAKILVNKDYLKILQNPKIYKKRQ